MNSEAKNTNDFEIESGKTEGLLVFRNNCGATKDMTGRPVFYGVGGPSARNRESIGGSDFIGIYYGRFCAFEIKADKDNTKKERLLKQENFISVIIKNGGFAGFVRRPIDIKLILSGKGCTKLSEYPKDRLK